jgi:hypothetical protein
MGRVALLPTLMITAVALAFTVLFGWLGARPLDLRRGPRLVPWRFLMVLAATVVLVMVVHLVNLAGFETGR